MDSLDRTERQYINQLTWLRGIAAFFVIISHVNRSTEVTYGASGGVQSSSLLAFLDLGGFGVTLFFVLSGCTLYISNATKLTMNRMGEFYLKRLFRIWPAFVVSLLVYIAFGPVFEAFYIDPQGHWIERQFMADYTVKDIFAYLSLSFNITGPGGLFNNAYWSLPVEFQYYLMFPFIILSLRVFGVIGPVAIGLGLYLLPKLGSLGFDRTTMFLLAYSFCGGVLIGYLYQRQSFRFSSMMGFSLLGGLFILVALIAKNIIELPDLPILSSTSNWYVLIGVLSVYVALFSKMNLPDKIAGFLQYYGTISYSTYLYHNLWIGVIVVVMIQLNITDTLLRVLITFPFVTLITYYTADISYRYVEKPFIQMSRRLGNYFERMRRISEAC